MHKYPMCCIVAKVDEDDLNDLPLQASSNICAKNPICYAVFGESSKRATPQRSAAFRKD